MMNMLTLRTIRRQDNSAGLAMATTTSTTSSPAVIAEQDEGPLELEQRDRQSSVHLQLGSDAMMPNDDNDNDNHPPKQTDHAVLHTYQQRNQESISGLNVAREKFEQWLHHRLPPGTKIEASDITTQNVSMEKIRPDMRDLWKSRRLLCDRTELLTVYQSDIKDTAQPETSNLSAPIRKRGGFADLLHLYAERHIGILQDEAENGPAFLLKWLRTEYNDTPNMLAYNFDDQPPETQRVILQSFLDWFRTTFPYYYDKCHKCGASCKQDGQDDGSFVGYVYPEQDELAGKAGRTEIYRCHKCHTVTRFPRFNSASHVLHEKRGRCGEYSMLLYRMLRAMGHETRWIVDWSDHVWCELLWDGRWVHLDPCEAAVDAPLLYQEWGKQQTYIIAFYAPLKIKGQHVYPAIEDITTKYTSDGMAAIQERRDASAENVDSAIVEVSLDLRNKLTNFLR
jgi:hypothetical protein